MNMNKCNACNKGAKTTDSILCTQTTCNKLYHYLCAGLKADNAKKLSSWKCPNCKIKQPKANNDDTPVRPGHCSEEETSMDDKDDFVNSRRRHPRQVDSPQSLDSEFARRMRHDILDIIRNEVPSIIKDLLSKEFQAMKDNIREFERSIKFISEKNDEIQKSISDTNVDIKRLKSENSNLRNELKDLQKNLKAVECDFSKQEQWARQQNVEIIGVPEKTGECLTDIVRRIAEKAGQNILDADIDFAHRVKSRRSSGTQPRTIIARFKQRHTKDTFLSATRKTKNLSTRDIISSTEEPKTIFINEHLTVRNKKLLLDSKAKAKLHGYRYVWTKNCRIYVRRSDSSPPILISTDSDLLRIV